MRKNTNILKALAFGLLAFAFYEVKAEMPVDTQLSIQAESSTIAPLHRIGA